jgi:hypothetical protein
VHASLKQLTHGKLGECHVHIPFRFWPRQTLLKPVPLAETTVPTGGPLGMSPPKSPKPACEVACP